MLRALIAITVGFCLACGAEEPQVVAAKAAPSRFDASENHPPVIEAVELSPDGAAAFDALSVTVQVKDPDRDAIEVTYEWYRNEQVFSEGTKSSLAPNTFKRGDHVYVVVYARDAESQSESRSETIQIANTLPRIASLELTPAAPVSGDMLEAKAEATDADGDPITLEYRWLLAGTPIPGETGPRLVPSRTRKGARISVQVQARDDSGVSGWVTSDDVAINNSAPRITSLPNYQLGADAAYEYQMQASDPDDDVPLKYELVTGPQGMTVDATQGLVSWRIQPGVSGTFPIELGVSDPYGAQVIQRYSLEVGWEEKDGEAANAAPRGEPGDEFGEPSQVEPGEIPDADEILQEPDSPAAARDPESDAADRDELDTPSDVEATELDSFDQEEVEEEDEL